MDKQGNGNRTVPDPSDVAKRAVTPATFCAARVNWPPKACNRSWTMLSYQGICRSCSFAGRSQRGALHVFDEPSTGLHPLDVVTLAGHLGLPAAHQAGNEAPELCLKCRHAFREAGCLGSALSCGP